MSVLKYSDVEQLGMENVVSIKEKNQFIMKQFQIMQLVSSYI